MPLQEAPLACWPTSWPRGTSSFPRCMLVEQIHLILHDLDPKFLQLSPDGLPPNKIPNGIKCWFWKPESNQNVIMFIS